MKNAAAIATGAVLGLALLLRAAGPAAAYPIDAKAAVVVGVDKSVVFAQNHTEKLPPASTTKLVTAMVVLDTLKADSLVTVSRNASRTSSVQPKLRPDDELTVEGLLHLALMRSVNSASVALAEEVAGDEDSFVKLMNIKAASLGALDTRFINSSGLPGKGQYTTAYDLTIIMEAALKYPLIREILGKKEIVVVTRKGRELKVENSDRLLWASDSVIGGKTGYTNLARHCFVGAIETDKGLLFACVLGAKSREKLWRTAGWLMGLGADLDPAVYAKAVTPKKAAKSGGKKKPRKGGKSSSSKGKSKSKFKTAQKTASNQKTASKK